MICVRIFSAGMRSGLANAAPPLRWNGIHRRHEDQLVGTAVRGRERIARDGMGARITCSDPDRRFGCHAGHLAVSVVMDPAVVDRSSGAVRGETPGRRHGELGAMAIVTGAVPR